MIEPVRPTRVLGYGRMSKETQELSPDVQRQQVEAWFAFQEKMGAWPDGAQWMGFICDDAVSSRLSLFERPQGQLIPVMLSANDVLVVSKHDRAFRSGADTELSLEKLAGARIRMVMLNLNGIDTSTHDGMMMATIFGAAARWERENTNRRTRETLQLKKSRGEPYTKAPRGWSIEGKRNRKRYVPNIVHRQLGNHAMRMICEGWSLERIYNHLLPFFERNGFDKPVGRGQIMCYATAAALGFPKQHFPDLRKQYGPSFNTVQFVIDHGTRRSQACQKN